METARVGDRVRIRYARVAGPDVAVAKRTRPSSLELTVGGSEKLPTLSMGVVGMGAGQHRRFTLPPGEAYGTVQPRLIREIPLRLLRDHGTLKVGHRLTVQGTSGRRRRVTVIDVKPDSVIVDGNHPLAGQSVEWDVTLVALKPSDRRQAGPSGEDD